MAQISIEVNGRAYLVGCEDGQERHLTDLARVFDAEVRKVSGEMGQLGDTRLFLMGALLLADELTDARTRPLGLQGELSRLQSEHARVETRAFQALDAAAQRIEKLAAG